MKPSAYRLMIAVACGVSITCATSLPAEDQIIADVVYGHKDGMALTYDVLKPEGEANGAGVLYMVSGGWRSRWYPPERSLDQFKGLLDRGFTVFRVRHGSSPKYDIPEIVSDVRRGVRFIRLHAAQYGVDANRLGVFGGSAGGHLSLVLGLASDDGDANGADEVEQTGNRVAAVVAYFPPTDLRPLVPPPADTRFPALDFDPAMAPDFSPIVHVTPDDPPTLLVHGDEDTLVALSHSTNIMTVFDQQQVTSKLIVLGGAGHGFGGEHAKQASDAMIAWFVEHLAAE